MKTTAPNHASGEHKKIIVIILIIIAVVAIIAALIFNLTGKNKNTAQGESQTVQDGQTNASEDTASSGETDASVLADTEAQINTLVTQYRTAFAQADIEALKTIYNTSDVMNSDVIAATAKIITGYENTECYIKDGMDDTSKVVFIYDDLKIDGIDTLIPNVAYVYLRQKDDGSYYIYPGEYDTATSDYVYSSDIQKYISELIKDNDINTLYASVNEKMTKAMNDDPAVKTFVEKLTSGEDSGQDESSSTETDESLSAADTSESSTSETSDTETSTASSSES